MKNAVNVGWINLQVSHWHWKTVFIFICVSFLSFSLCRLTSYSVLEVTFIFIYTHTHTHTHLTALCPGLPEWAGTRKVKPIWILLKQETVSGSGISWAVCKSAPCSMPAPHHSVFTGQMPFLPPNQQRQSTEGFITLHSQYNTFVSWRVVEVGSACNVVRAYE